MRAGFSVKGIVLATRAYCACHTSKNDNSQWDQQVRKKQKPMSCLDFHHSHWHYLWQLQLTNMSACLSVNFGALTTWAKTALVRMILVLFGAASLKKWYLTQKGFPLSQGLAKNKVLNLFELSKLNDWGKKPSKRRTSTTSDAASGIPHQCKHTIWNAWHTLIYSTSYNVLKIFFVPLHLRHQNGSRKNNSNWRKTAILNQMALKH